jgi:hypothetical protein
LWRIACGYLAQGCKRGPERGSSRAQRAKNPKLCPQTGTLEVARSRVSPQRLRSRLGARGSDAVQHGTGYRTPHTAVRPPAHIAHMHGRGPWRPEGPRHRPRERRRERRTARRSSGGRTEAHGWMVRWHWCLVCFPGVAVGSRGRVAPSTPSSQRDRSERSSKRQHTACGVEVADPIAA